MAASELAVVLLWHMHQPDYVDSFTGRIAMPWARLHALLSYFDMVRLVREAPGTRVVFNLVPTLLLQVESAAAGGPDDDFLALARPEPADLSAEQRSLLLRRLFAFHHGRRFAELPRLGELWHKREALAGSEEARAALAFSDAELRDLQVGFQLAWSGRTLREQPLVEGLLRKGRGFTPAEKKDLLALQQEFLAGVLPAYRRIAGDGLAEISCTPYSHPILPLLCDLRSALEARPELKLPASGFAFPGDAWFHVQTALAETERLIGVRPAGMWPAEGSLSEEAIRIWSAAGVRWLASDQEVLEASWEGQPPAEGHFRPYRWGGDRSPALFFRDKGLSDRIGFVYSAWAPERAAADLVGHVQRIRSALPPGRFVLPIILDGENAWEAYPDNGAGFLRALYAGVAAAPGCRWSTFNEYLESDGGSVRPLPRLRAGSWIRHDFTTWIGNPEKNRAWERLAETRAWLGPRLAAAEALRAVQLAGGGSLRCPDPQRVGPGAAGPLAKAWLAMAAAQGSDWFWWYGDDHATDFATEFDALFRAHLGNVYRHLGEEPPPALDIPISARPLAAVRLPRAPLEVTLDGKVTSYFEWLDAGQWTGAAQGAMQRADAPVTGLWFGADTERLLLRLDAPSEQGARALAGLTIAVHRADPDGAARSVALEFAARSRRRGAIPLAEKARAMALSEKGAPAGGAEGVCDQVIELAVPWARLDLAPGREFAFYVTLERDGQVEARLPPAGALAMRAPLAEDDADWLV